jgi:multidrug efflux pump
MGVMPLTFAVGAGAEMRRAMGVAVFAGMLGVTLFGLVLTPVFYVVLRAIEKVLVRREVPKNSKPAECCPQMLRRALA